MTQEAEIPKMTDAEMVERLTADNLELQKQRDDALKAFQDMKTQFIATSKELGEIKRTNSVLNAATLSARGTTKQLAATINEVLGWVP